MGAPTWHVPSQISPGRRAEWHETLTTQHGVINLRQLLAFSMTWAAVRANVRAARWQLVLPRVYATFTGPLPRESRIAAALLYAGDPAILSHRTAAEQWGMRTGQPGAIHVTVPYNSSAVSQPLVTVHRSRAFQYIAVAGEPPLTSRADTAVDLAVAEDDARDAQRVLTELITGRRVSAGQVRERLAMRPPRRHRFALEQALNRTESGVCSVLEEVYAVEVEQAHGIPEARRQLPVWVDGRRLYEDVGYDELGIPLTVRLDGRTHLEPDVAYRDRRRGNVAVLNGRDSLVFGWRELEEAPCSAAREVASLLHRHGWQGPLLRCAKCPGQAREWQWLL